MATNGLQVGSRVRIKELRNQAHFNGCLAVVEIIFGDGKLQVRIIESPDVRHDLVTTDGSNSSQTRKLKLSAEKVQLEENQGGQHEPGNNSTPSDDTKLALLLAAQAGRNVTCESSYAVAVRLYEAAENKSLASANETLASCACLGLGRVHLNFGMSTLAVGVLKKSLEYATLALET